MTNGAKVMERTNYGLFSIFFELITLKSDFSKCESDQSSAAQRIRFGGGKSRVAIAPMDVSLPKL